MVKTGSVSGLVPSDPFPNDIQDTSHSVGIGKEETPGKVRGHPGPGSK